MSYQEALDKSLRAEKVYSEAVASYRARKIGDAEFVAARKVRDAVSAEFDAAYAVAAGW